MAILLAFATGLSAEDAAAGLWLRLSVEVQNVTRDLQQLARDASPDLETLREDMKPVEKVLDELVEAGALKRKTVRLRSWKELAANGGQHLTGFLDAMARRHGYFVALVLMDLQPHRRFEWEQFPDRPVTLRVCLPERHLAEFEELLAKHGILDESPPDPGNTPR